MMSGEQYLLVDMLQNISAAAHWSRWARTRVATLARCEDYVCISPSVAYFERADGSLIVLH